MARRPRFDSVDPEDSSGPEKSALAALANGDPDAALSVLMEAYGNSVFAYCYQVMKNRHLAEEVLQETFFQAHRGFARFAGKSTLRTWVFSIAHHRCLDALKKERNQAKKVQAMAELPEAADPAPGPDGSFAAREFVEVLRECLQRLSPEARAAVLLRFREELTYPEMSAACGVREATLQARVTRALPVLRRCVEAMGYQL